MLRTTVNAHLVLRVGRWEYLKAVWRCLEFKYNSSTLFTMDALVDSFAFRPRIKHPLSVLDCRETARFWHWPLAWLAWVCLWYFAMLPYHSFTMVSHGITMVLWYHNIIYHRYSQIVSPCLASMIFHGSLKWVPLCSTMFSARWDTAALGPAWIGSSTSWKHRDLPGMAWATAGFVCINGVIRHDLSRCHTLSSFTRREVSSGFKWSVLSRCIVL